MQTPFNSYGDYAHGPMPAVNSPVVNSPQSRASRGHSGADAAYSMPGAQRMASSAHGGHSHNGEPARTASGASHGRPGYMPPPVIMSESDYQVRGDPYSADGGAYGASTASSSQGRRTAHYSDGGKGEPYDGSRMGSDGGRRIDPVQSSSTYGVTDGWLTVAADARVSTVAAPDLKGKLENALDNIALSGELFLGRFALLSSAHRRAGGQGIVQVRAAPRCTVFRACPFGGVDLSRLTRGECRNRARVCSLRAGSTTGRTTRSSSSQRARRLSARTPSTRTRCCGT